MIIPIGADCGGTEFIRDNNLRINAMPFDWVVTYNGISNIIKTDFLNYIPGDGEKLNSICDVWFLHNDFPSDTEKTLMRINRFKQILETSQEHIIFLRKGHSPHHHKEHNCKYNDIKNDLIDAEDLDIVLQEKYPNLKYEIVVILICGRCFNKEDNYTTNSKNIKIYNISMPAMDNNKFNSLCTDLFIAKK